MARAVVGGDRNAFGARLKDSPMCVPISHSGGGGKAISTTTRTRMDPRTCSRLVEALAIDAAGLLLLPDALGEVAYDSVDVIWEGVGQIQQFHHGLSLQLCAHVGRGVARFFTGVTFLAKAHMGTRAGSSDFLGVQAILGRCTTTCVSWACTMRNAAKTATDAKLQNHRAPPDLVAYLTGAGRTTKTYTMPARTPCEDRGRWQLMFAYNSARGDRPHTFAVVARPHRRQANIVGPRPHYDYSVSHREGSKT